MSVLIEDNTVVSMHYTLTDDSGAVIDSSEGEEPLAYLHGAGNIIPGLERALAGKAAGDTLQVSVTPDQGYGEIDAELIQIIDRAAFSGVDTIEVGMTFETVNEEGDAQSVEVTAVEGDNITIDGNHPLAGINLNFAIEIVEVRAASDEELAHGHAH